jgi:iron(III) transport system substrate-binding protein
LTAGRSARADPDDIRFATRSHLMFTPARPTAFDRIRTLAATAVGLLLVLAACSTGGGSPPPSPTAAPGGTFLPSGTSLPSATAQPGGTITLYTSVTQATVDAVADGFRDAHPGVTVEVFRAPTAEVAARIATDLQSGGIRADVLWLTDPLSIAPYADQGLLQAWSPPSASAIPAAYRTDTFFGTRLLNMVIVRGASVAPGPSDWQDLLAADLRDAVGIPDPGFAGSAFAALAHFDQAPGYGMAFYRSLQSHGATQVKSPDDVTTGVAEGRFKAGVTLDNSARTALRKGSPIALVWPASGAIAIYSPIAAVASSSNLVSADAFVEFTLSGPGQALIAGTGWQPVVGSGGPAPEGTQVSPDWAAAFGRQKELLDGYRAIFGG